jgi:hypothetical protein
MKIQIETKHNLNQEDAKQKLLNEMSLMQNEYKRDLKDLVIEWKDDYSFITSFKVMGMKFEGDGKLENNNLISNLTLPAAAMLFHTKIKKALEDKLSSLLSG